VRSTSGLLSPSKRRHGALALGRAEETGLDRSRKQEDDLAERLGGQRQLASGALPGFKGDVKAAEFLVECKRTDKKSIVLHAEWLEKIFREALEQGRYPAVEVEIGGAERHARKWVLIPSALWDGKTT
jgi:hypothetical protein